MLTNLATDDYQKYGCIFKLKESKDLEKEKLGLSQNENGKLLLKEDTKEIQKEQKITLEVAASVQKIKILINKFFANGTRGMRHLFNLGKLILQKFKLLSFSGITNKFILIEFVYKQVINEKKRIHAKKVENLKDLVSIIQPVGIP